MSSTGLKPCPFCGGEVECIKAKIIGIEIFAISHKSRLYNTESDKRLRFCIMQESGYYEKQEYLIEAWNTRI